MEAEHGPHAFYYLGSGKMDYEVLAKIVKNFFGADVPDRRKYKGKHKNSPMLIKFYE